MSRAGSEWVMIDCPLCGQILAVDGAIPEGEALSRHQLAECPETEETDGSQRGDT